MNVSENQVIFPLLSRKAVEFISIQSPESRVESRESSEAGCQLSAGMTRVWGWRTGLLLSFLRKQES